MNTTCIIQALPAHKRSTMQPNGQKSFQRNIFIISVIVLIVLTPLLFIWPNSSLSVLGYLAFVAAVSAIANGVGLLSKVNSQRNTQLALGIVVIVLGFAGLIRSLISPSVIEIGPYIYPILILIGGYTTIKAFRSPKI